MSVIKLLIFLEGSQSWCIDKVVSSWTLNQIAVEVVRRESQNFRVRVTENNIITYETGVTND